MRITLTATTACLCYVISEGAVLRGSNQQPEDSNAQAAYGSSRLLQSLVTAPPTGSRGLAAAGPCPECNICGDGYEITNPDGIIVPPTTGIPGSCENFQLLANLGYLGGCITPEVCAELQSIAPGECGCGPTF